MGFVSVRFNLINLKPATADALIALQIYPTVVMDAILDLF